MFDPNEPPRLAIRLRAGLRALGFDEDLKPKAIRELQAEGYFPPDFPLTNEPDAPRVVRWDALVAIIERQQAVGQSLDKIAAAKRRQRTEAATRASIERYRVREAGAAGEVDATSTSEGADHG
jgi:hypothetical protein